MKDTFIPNQPILAGVDNPKNSKSMRLQNDFTYYDQYEKAWTAPAGTLTDGASIPCILWSLIGDRSDARYFRAAIVHDYFCEKADESQTKEERCKYREQVDKMFRQACICCGSGETLAGLLFIGVRIGALLPWSPGKASVQALGFSQAEIDAKIVKVYEEMVSSQSFQGSDEYRGYETQNYPEMAETSGPVTDDIPKRGNISVDTQLYPGATRTFNPATDGISEIDDVNLDTQITLLLQKEGLL
jgi:hypothetical protein